MGGFPEFCLSSVTLRTRVWTAVAKGTCVTIQWLDNQTKTENPLTLPRNCVGKIILFWSVCFRKWLNRTPSLPQPKVLVWVLYLFSGASSAAFFKAAQKNMLLLNIPQKKNG